MKYLPCFLFFIFFLNTCFCQDSITLADIHSSEKIISLHFTEAKEDSLAGSVRDRSREYDKMHRFSLDNSIPMSMMQSPLLPYMDLNKKTIAGTIQYSIRRKYACK